ncbi:hypothetical protein A246_25043 [Pseudomonas syringae pv. actinidiae ICMP 19098]|nr:hypothetical protein A246_25043 [Pseudomonas syringae pv. actinidiae ICMP 19098]
MGMPFVTLRLKFLLQRNVMPGLQSDADKAAPGPECVKTRQNVVGAQRLLSVVGYLAPKSF